VPPNAGSHVVLKGVSGTKGGQQVGRNALVVLFLICCGISLFAFLNREKPDVREFREEHAAKEPHLILEEFTVYRYNQHNVTETLAAKLGYFLEPNILELYGDIRGFRHGPKREYCSAESSISYFDSHSLTSLLRNAKIVKTEVETQVRVGIEDHALRTEFAEFIADLEVIRTDFPVKIDGPRGRFNGEKGFVYDLKAGLMMIRGPMTGTLKERKAVED